MQRPFIIMSIIYVAFITRTVYNNYFIYVLHLLLVRLSRMLTTVVTVSSYFKYLISFYDNHNLVICLLLSRTMYLRRSDILRTKLAQINTLQPFQV